MVPGSHLLPDSMESLEGEARLTTKSQLEKAAGVSSVFVGLSRYVELGFEPPWLGVLVQ